MDPELALHPLGFHSYASFPILLPLHAPPKTHLGCPSKCLPFVLSRAHRILAFTSVLQTAPTKVAAFHHTQPSGPTCLHCTVLLAPCDTNNPSLLLEALGAPPPFQKEHFADCAPISWLSLLLFLLVHSPHQVFSVSALLSLARWFLAVGQGASRALQGVEQHPCLLPTRCQKHPPAVTKTSPDIAKCPLGV